MECFSIRFIGFFLSFVSHYCQIFSQYCPVFCSHYCPTCSTLLPFHFHLPSQISVISKVHVDSNEYGKNYLWLKTKNISVSKPKKKKKLQNNWGKTKMEKRKSYEMMMRKLRSYIVYTYIFYWMQLLKTKKKQTNFNACTKYTYTYYIHYYTTQISPLHTLMISLIGCITWQTTTHTRQLPIP